MTAPDKYFAKYILRFLWTSMYSSIMLCTTTDGLIGQNRLTTKYMLWSLATHANPGVFSTVMRNSSFSSCSETKHSKICLPSKHPAVYGKSRYSRSIDGGVIRPFPQEPPRRPRGPKRSRRSDTSRNLRLASSSLEICSLLAAVQCGAAGLRGWQQMHNDENDVHPADLPSKQPRESERKGQKKDILRCVGLVSRFATK